MAEPTFVVVSAAVEQARVVTRDDAQLLFLLVGLAIDDFLILLHELQQEVPAIRRPCQAGDVALEIRKATRLPAVSIDDINPVSYTHLRAHETRHDLVCRLLLEKKKNNKTRNTAKVVDNK